MIRNSLLAAIFAGAGCTTTIVDVPEGASRGIRVAEDVAPSATIPMDSVVIVDKGLQYTSSRTVNRQPAWLSIFAGGAPVNLTLSKIAVERTNARRSPTGTVEAWATFRNRTDFPLALECRTHFFDRDQAPVEAPSAWKRIFLPAQSIANYNEFSTNIMDVGHYYVEVREAR